MRILLELCIWCCLFTRAVTYRITEISANYTVLIGEEITFECNTNIEKPPSLSWVSLAWGNSTMMLAMNGEVYPPFTSRYSSTLDGTRATLTIQEASLDDEDEFYCMLMGISVPRVNYQLTVNIPAEIERSDDNYEIPLGDGLTVACRATGKPQPDTHWVWEDKFGVEQQLHGDELVLHHAYRHDSGERRCVAHNGAGEDDVWPINIVVTYAPSVTPTDIYFHTGPGDTVQLECQVQAGPPAVVAWLKNGYQVQDDDHITVAEEIDVADPVNHIHTLTINKLRPEDIGQYRCYAENKIDSAYSDFTLSAKPERLNYLSSENSLYSDEYTLEWQFMSYAQPVECILKTSQTTVNGTEYLGNATVPIPSEPTSDNIRLGTYKYQGLEVNATYEVAIQCKNTHDVSDFTQSFTFYTPHEIHKAPVVIYSENSVDSVKQDENIYTVYSDTTLSTLTALDVMDSVESGVSPMTASFVSLTALVIMTHVLKV